MSYELTEREKRIYKFEEEIKDYLKEQFRNHYDSNFISDYSKIYGDNLESLINLYLTLVFNINNKNKKTEGFTLKNLDLIIEFIHPYLLIRRYYLTSKVLNKLVKLLEDNSKIEILNIIYKRYHLFKNSSFGKRNILMKIFEKGCISFQNIDFILDQKEFEKNDLIYMLANNQNIEGKELQMIINALNLIG